MPRRRTALVISLSVLLLLGIATSVAALRGWGPFTAEPVGPEPVPSTTTEDAVPAEPTPASPTAPAPTAQPANPSEPDEPVGPTTEAADPSVEPTAPGGTDAATVVITYAGWEGASTSVEAGAYAALLEPAGTCTLTLTQGPVIKTQTIDALTDVSTMSCGGFQISGADLATGTWTAVVTYESGTSKGTSAPVDVVVP